MGMKVKVFLKSGEMIEGTGRDYTGNFVVIYSKYRKSKCNKKTQEKSHRYNWPIYLGDIKSIETDVE